ncbi:T7SS effector LXG polymorphic toxin [Priestia koreensis]|uniref:T7SS effector LXG polymorphic toxin n=1 Tax=Priestia koreensis TaxID=284581 RepID=UPI003D070787
MGKVYEAHTLLYAAREREEAYKSLYGQLKVLKKALHSVATLDDDFKGKGADKIKNFYQAHVDIVTHWKSLVSSHQAYFGSVADYVEKAKLEVDLFIDVSFLEHDLAVGNHHSLQMITQQKEELATILHRIDDIVHLTPFSEKVFEKDIEAAEKKRIATIDAVEGLDDQLSSEYKMLAIFFESVQSSINSLQEMTSSGSSAYQLYFDAKAYQNSDAYKAQKEIDQMASGYVRDKKEQKQRINDQKAAIKAEKQLKMQANKPWYEKAGDLAGEFSGYYDYKRAVDGVDPVTNTKLSAMKRTASGAMAAAGFIPFVGWAGRAIKGGNVAYKATKGIHAAQHSLALYQTPKSFKVLQETEKGIYGFLLSNGMYEYTMGKDVLGNKLTDEERQASLFQSTTGLLGVGVTVKGAAGIADDLNQATDMARSLKQKGQYKVNELLFNNAGLAPQRALVFAEQGRSINTLSNQYREDVSTELYHSTMMLMSRSSASQSPVTGHTVEHVFHGQINGIGKAVGYHHESMMGGGEILNMLAPPDSRGIYKAKVAVKGKRKDAPSTFFPKDWNRVQVLNAINEAYENKRVIRPRDRFYEGTTSEGIRIQMYLNRYGKIKTAFPIRETRGR